MAKKERGYVGGIYHVVLGVFGGRKTKGSKIIKLSKRVSFRHFFVVMECSRHGGFREKAFVLFVVPQNDQNQRRERKKWSDGLKIPLCNLFKMFPMDIKDKITEIETTCRAMAELI